MTCGMLLLSIVLVFSGALASSYLGFPYGFLGYVLGFLFGFLACYGLLWIILVGRLRLFFPLPRCKRGNCRNYDGYYWPVGTIYGWEWWGVYRYRCKCSDDEYVRRGKRFMEVSPDEQNVHYKKLCGFRKWTDDK